ncbi:Flp pilus assembly CpaB [Novosphingobium nitrogenifigens DSM 19370]|uniref:Flp pilus assembly CpaB n=1 Tax=Novosphingobium nitrogenifigens DSM 19370 TaxID=983920 RepID=F1ZDF9_9SPHN|nr:Flp pilus assembly protein CpaB [Novosphingobium nitrogenifigens]EGD57300.1 Flp pilus assembly CpaB [Novosphingobium nitrogenifigens DSM 19370]
MDRKKLILLVGALIFAIATSLAARALLTGGSTPQAIAAAKVLDGPKVLVAQRALPVGTIITADAVSYQAWPKDLVQDAYFLQDKTDMQKLLGTVVRNPITAGQPITTGSLVAPGDRGFLAAALGPGMRAVTIPVSTRTGVAGFVFPGDHVDLLLTQSVKGDGESQALKATETILKNLRVLATDQSTDQETVDGHTRVKGFSLVTVEATPKIAEELAVAESIGTISLSLRSIADNSSELEQAVASGQVKFPAGASKAEEDRLIKAAMGKPIDKGTTYVTGGDVSRFQRKTMPSANSINGVSADSSPSQASPSRPGAGNGQPQLVFHRGPVVRITRGKDTQEVSLHGGN